MGRGLAGDVEGDRHGSVVDEMDSHVSAKDPGGDLGSSRTEALGDGIDEGLGYWSRCRGVPRGPAALASVRVESELADDKHGESKIGRGYLPADIRREWYPRHSRVLVSEDSQVVDLVGQRGCDGLIIVMRDPDEDDEPGSVE